MMLDRRAPSLHLRDATLLKIVFAVIVLGGASVQLAYLMWRAPSPAGDPRLADDVAPAPSWDLCDEVPRAVWFELATPPGRMYVVGADVTTADGATFPMGAYRIDAGAITGVEARVSSSGEWAACSVQAAKSQDVAVCPGLLAQVRALPATQNVAAVELRDRSGGGSVSLDICRRSRRRHTPKGGVPRAALCVVFATDVVRPGLLAEFAEYHALQGVTHIFLYDKTTGPRHYADVARELGLDARGRRLVTAVRWPVLSHDPTNDVPCRNYYDQVPAQMHCAWNARRKYDLVYLSDLDEWVFPGADFGGKTVTQAAHDRLSDSSYACISMGVTDIGTHKPRHEWNRSVIEQWRTTSTGSSWPKQVCVPERIWGTTIHYPQPAPGWKWKKEPVAGFRLAHYRPIFRPLGTKWFAPTSGTPFNTIYDKFYPEVKRRLRAYGNSTGLVLD
eukprot:m51a1_g1742 hypothetical protein (446) ;mRNA; f:186975-188461